jgi:hypothetical protein
MNPEGFAVFIPIVALCIPVAGIIFRGLEKVARLRVEEAKVRAGQLDGQSAAELATLREEMGDGSWPRCRSGSISPSGC